MRFLCSVVASSGTQISDEGIAALRMVGDEMNLKRGPDERDLQY